MCLNREVGLEDAQALRKGASGEGGKMTEGSGEQGGSGPGWGHGPKS